MSGWRLEKKSQTAYRFKKKEGRALVALLSFLCNRNEVSYYIKKSVFWQENWSYQIPDGRLHKNMRYDQNATEQRNTSAQGKGHTNE